MNYGRLLALKQLPSSLTRSIDQETLETATAR